MKILKRFNIYMLLFILNIIELTTYGSIMLSVGDEISPNLSSVLKSLSTTLYLLSTISGQLFFNIFSEIPLVAGPISEVSISINGIMKEAYAENRDTFIANGLFAIFLSTILYSIFSFLLVPYSKYLRRFPLAISNGIMVGTGIMQFEVPTILFNPSRLKYIILFTFVIFIILVEKKYSLQHFSFICAIIGTIILYIHKKEENFSQPISFIQGFKIFANNNFKNLSRNTLLKLSPKIFSTCFLCLLQLPANLLAYESITKKSFNFSKELKTQGIANILSSIFILPVYFICPYSTILSENMLGRFDAFFLVLVFSVIFFVFNFVLKIVPLFIQSLFPVHIGLTMCLDYTYDAYLNSYIDLSITLIVALSSIKFPMIISFVIGLIYSLIIRGILRYKYGKQTITTHVYENYTCFIFGKYLLFDYYNQLLSSNHTNIIVDITNNVYFDLNIRNILHNIKEKNNLILVTKKPLKDFKCFKRYEDAVVSFK